MDFKVNLKIFGLVFKWCPKPDLNWHASKGEGF
ncbi:hypothetical protein CGSHi22421_00005 [Haemophilus influenzae R3021]|uniref:Uncharacterized protein n=1 Tax=Haemophilus influenzae R3021 TaxID=375432 RepID=A4N4P8_HAEIF|nr:hypothetical protein CGSHi22421_00005 [Haemophilus influenzae R3021]